MFPDISCFFFFLTFDSWLLRPICSAESVHIRNLSELSQTKEQILILKTSRETHTYGNGKKKLIIY